ncbi:hypothetical protein ABZ845_27065 [Streptomyces sp. NPDC047022]|uniref:hypothetical protein n=1 Tax=Streptomyces sp. NPDC047022 TaxID=3155737 RepID=UPI0033F241CB
MAATYSGAGRVALAAACATALAGCWIGATRSEPGMRKPSGAPAPGRAVSLIGDGSTSYTGAQPHLPRPDRLKPGRRPPQFVVFSWDGADEDGHRLFSHFRKVAKANNATMTYFLSGLYLLPETKRELYRPPRHSPGSSDIGFNDESGIRSTAEQLRLAWLEGNEIGTHFNGHFCTGESGADGDGAGEGGVGQWSAAEWKGEIAQAKSFVKSWKTNSGLKEEPSLPFDYDKELIGGRTPCLQGRQTFLRAAQDLGFRYDSSGVDEQIWPSKTDGLWDLSMQLVPFPGHDEEQVSMDYAFMTGQSGTQTQGDPDKFAEWGDQLRDGLLQGFQRAYDGNRAPLVIGNHFESWNGGTYMRAVQEVIERVCTLPEVRCVSFHQLADWLDTQNPDVLDRLRTLKVGQAPAQGWRSFLGGPVPVPKRPPGAPPVRR